jgi:hypothetical protein
MVSAIGPARWGRPGPTLRFCATNLPAPTALVGAGLPAVTQPPNNGCGYICHAPGVDIYEVSWRFCLNNCPGGPSNCSAGPFPPCP